MNTQEILDKAKRDSYRTSYIDGNELVISIADLEQILTAQDGWISVEDRLPKEGEYVLVAYPFEGGFGAVVKLAIFSSYYRDNRGRYSKNRWWNEDTCEMINGVDRWCQYPPLPTPPKEGE